MRIRIQRLEGARDLSLPAPASAGSAGLDLRAAAPLVLAPQERALVPTGIVVEIPPGFEGQIRPRSGLALHHGVTVLNAPGTIDSDYRGEVKVLLVNFGAAPYAIGRGERIAQLVVAPVAGVEWDDVETLAPSQRGEGGFGSTGC